MKNVTLVLSDGTKFHGKSFGYDAPVAGEVVFNTAMMGYPESLTDPSYAGQLMTLTYPLVGNYGVPPFTIESNGIPTFMNVCSNDEELKRFLQLAANVGEDHPVVVSKFIEHEKGIDSFLELFGISDYDQNNTYVLC
jgi:Carbamoylphosphate synthase small subunit